MKKVGRTKLILIGGAIVFAISSVFITLETVGTGAEISKLEQTEKELLAEKQVLESNYVKTVSLNELQEKSADLGFIKADNMIFLSKSESVAQAH